MYIALHRVHTYVHIIYMYILYILNNTFLSNIVSSIYKIIIYIGTVYEK